MYALAVQVDPTVTPDRFWETAIRTARTVQIDHEGEMYPPGTILDPPALIRSLHAG
jgi:hypothetical protein